MAEYKLWFTKAKDDLLWTQHNVESKVFYGACFTAHQATEKALKSFLLYKGKRLRKIHDLVALLEDCIKIDQEFSSLKDPVKVLLPYYIGTRYPMYEELSKFTETQAKEAYTAASSILEYIGEKLPQRGFF